MEVVVLLGHDRTLMQERIAAKEGTNPLDTDALLMSQQQFAQQNAKGPPRKKLTAPVRGVMQ